jgi:serine/threonine-protein kinase RsbW
MGSDVFDACRLGCPSDADGGNAIGGRGPLDLAAEAKPEKARQLRVCLQYWLRALGAPCALVEDLCLAAYEALTNVVDHAYHPGHLNPIMSLRARADQGQLTVTVSDQGRWRPPQHPGYRGRGLVMMRALTTELHLYPTAEGTTVQLRAALHHR